VIFEDKQDKVGQLPPQENENVPIATNERRGTKTISKATEFLIKDLRFQSSIGPMGLDDIYHDNENHKTENHNNKRKH
jgi:hypothetical protein